MAVRQSINVYTNQQWSQNGSLRNTYSTDLNSSFILKGLMTEPAAEIISAERLTLEPCFALYLLWMTRPKRTAAAFHLIFIFFFLLWKNFGPPQMFWPTRANDWKSHDTHASRLFIFPQTSAGTVENFYIVIFLEQSCRMLIFFGRMPLFFTREVVSQGLLSRRGPAVFVTPFHHGFIA